MDWFNITFNAWNFNYDDYTNYLMAGPVCYSQDHYQNIQNLRTYVKENFVKVISISVMYNYLPLPIISFKLKCKIPAYNLGKHLFPDAGCGECYRRKKIPNVWGLVY